MKQEIKELEILTGKGIDIKLRLFGKNRIVKSRLISLGLMFELSSIFIKMDFDEEALNSDDIREQLATQYQSVLKNAKHASKVVAVCVTKNPIYQWYIRRAVMKYYSPKDLLEFTQNLLKEADYTPFVTSTALMNANRPTKAQAVEK